MRFGLHANITGALCVLLSLATALTFSVTTLFWLRQAALLVAREKEQQIGLIVDAAAGQWLGPEAEQPFLPTLVGATVLGSGAVAGCATLGEGTPACSGADPAQQAALERLLAGTLATGASARVLAGLAWVGLVPAHRSLDVAVPIHPPDRPAGAISLRFPLDRLLHAEARALHRYALLYLVVNLLALLALGVLYLHRTIVRPVIQLIRRTDAYTDEGGLPFLALEGGSELGQLAGSLQRMLARIRADRDTLRDHVASLEAANQQLIAARGEMVRTEKLASVGRLAAGLAHEIGNPVGIVQGYVGLVQQPGLTATEREDFCSRADQELQRISRLVRQLLDLARPAGGPATEVDVHQVLDEVVTLLRPQPLLDGIDLRLDLQAAGTVVRADAGQLVQVFLNGLINAADSVRQAGRHTDGTIRVATADGTGAGGPVVRVTITDNGVGLDPAEAAAAFDPFYTTKEPGRGTGLGLSVSHAMVTALGGDITLAGEAAGGAVLTIVLPLARPSLQ